MKNFKFLKLIKDRNGYEYCERKGKDSIAFILVRKYKDKIEWGVRNEYKPPIREWLLGAFGGSLDKKKSLVNTLIDEVLEEAGYLVAEDNITYCGKFFVSTQMNQFCYLYGVDVTNAKFVGKSPQDQAEEISDVHWVSTLKYETDCWKTRLIQDYVLNKVYE